MSACRTLPASARRRCSSRGTTSTPAARVPDFRGRLDAAIEALGVGKDAALYFICRSGSRSRNAAIEATAGGYAHCYNVEDGFEGNLSPEGHRGTAGSWKAEGLPWAQT